MKNMLESGRMERPMPAHLVNWLMYLVSLPERCLRAAAGLIGGALLISFDILFPSAIKRATLYRLLIGDGLRFIVERIAGISGEGLPLLPHDYHRRKLAGSAIEGLGLLAVQFSPLWVFAIAGDAATGGSIFMRRLVEHLKRQGVIEENVSIDDLTDLLDALQIASHTTVEVIDTPPLTRPELEQMAGEMKAAYGRLFRGTQDLQPRFERIWSEMIEISHTPRLSLASLMRFMNLEMRIWAKRSGGMVKAMGATSTELFGEHILDGYQRTLEELKQGGLAAYFRIRFAPYRAAAVAQFLPEIPSWTERQLLSGG
jgi:hypothetical protein